MAKQSFINSTLRQRSFSSSLRCLSFSRARVPAYKEFLQVAFRGPFFQLMSADISIHRALSVTEDQQIICLGEGPARDRATVRESIICPGILGLR